MLIDGVEVAPLIDRLRRDPPLSTGCQAAFEKVIAQVYRVVLSDERRSGLDVGVGELEAVAHQRRKLPDDPVDLLEAGRLAVDEQFVALRADADVEERFEMLEVLVVGTEQRFDPFFRDGDALH